jgi:threonine dehydrogenase-like Zn-dependent dehydrogenase
VDLSGAELWLILDRTILENSNVAVFGVGCVGLSILQGARAKKCAKVIAIDVNNGKKETALKFGASKPLFISLFTKRSHTAQPTSSTPRSFLRDRASSTS